MEEAFRRALRVSAEQFLSLAGKHHQNRLHRSAMKAALGKCSRQVALDLCDALARQTELAVRHLCREEEEEEGGGGGGGEEEEDEGNVFKTPSPPRPKRPRRKAGKSNAMAETLEETLTESLTERDRVGVKWDGQKKAVESLKCCAAVALAVLSSRNKSFHPCDLFPAVQSLHDHLVRLQEEPELQDTIGSLCETWWKGSLPGRESLIAQSVPFLLSRALEVGRRADTQRACALRDALPLFDFADESIDGLKHLLIRCFLAPSFLHPPDGRRFLSFLFTLNPQLVKEIMVIIRSQIPFGRKSILDAYSEVIFRAWRTATDAYLEQIEQSLQEFIEGAIYASDKTLSSSIRKVFGEFSAQRMQEGVESLLFRLLEPLIFRALQVANSDVRRNALLLLIDMFPLENPDASNEEKEAVLEKQMLLLEKLLFDPCPGIRMIAVEGLCRILRLFWEVVPSSIVAKLLYKAVDELGQDQMSTGVRCAVIEGITYLLENPQTHDLLKMLLPRLAPLLGDTALSVRIAVADMLLRIKGIRAIHIHKVISLNSLLSSLASDHEEIARRLTGLLIPSYFPTKLPLPEACERCLALIKRSPQAGARFCKWALAEGVPATSLLELTKVFVRSFGPEGDLDSEGRDGILIALVEVANNLVSSDKENKVALEGLLTRDALKSMLKYATASATRAAVLRLASILPPKEVPELFKHCGQLVGNVSGDTLAKSTPDEVRSFHLFVLAWGGFDDLMNAIILLLPPVHFLVSENTQKTPAKRGKSSAKKQLQSKGLQRTLRTSSCKKKGKIASSSPMVGSDDEDDNSKLLSAIAGAWHIENLLEEERTKSALLAHDCLAQILLGLESAAKMSMTISLTFNISDFLKVSPIRAYAALVTHMAISVSNGKDSTDPVSDEVGETQKESTAGTSDEGDSKPNNDLTKVMEELIQWTLSMQGSLRTKNPSMCLGPTSVIKKDLKRVRKNNRHKPQLDVDIIASGVEKRAEAQTFLYMLRVTTTSMRSLMDICSLEMADITTHEACIEFSSESIKWIASWLHSQTQPVVNPSVKEGVSGDQSKELLASIKASCTYGSKLLYLRLKSCMEGGACIKVPVASQRLANNLLDLVAESEQLVGSKMAANALLAAIKPWLPDLFISVSLPALDERNEHGMLQSFPELASYGSQFSSNWLPMLCETVFRSMDSSDDHLEDTPKEEASCFSSHFLLTVCELLQRGSPLVLEGVLNMTLGYAGMCMYSVDKQNYRGTVGALVLAGRRLAKPGLLKEEGMQKRFLTQLQIIQSHLNELPLALRTGELNVQLALQLVDSMICSYAPIEY